MAKLAGQKLRASYVSGSAAASRLSATGVVTTRLVAGSTVKASQIP